MAYCRTNVVPCLSLAFRASTTGHHNAETAIEPHNAEIVEENPA